MKRILALLIALAMLLSLAGCTQPEAPDTPTETTPTGESGIPTVPTYPDSDNPVTFLSLSLGENYEDIRYISVTANEDGTVRVEFVGDVKKVGDLPGYIFNGITATLEESGLTALNGQEVWSDGEANGSMYIEFADGTYLTASFSGEIPESYSQGYSVMEDFFTAATASLPVYVPQATILGQVNPMLLDEVNAIAEAGGIQNLDSYTISTVAKDESFAYTLGLSSDEGIGEAVSFAPMMMTSAYSLVIVTLEEGTDRKDICTDFLENLDWSKWVCVAPTHALIATKGHMVLCLMAADQLYEQSAAGVKAAGWDVFKVLENRR